VITFRNVSGTPAGLVKRGREPGEAPPEVALVERRGQAAEDQSVLRHTGDLALRLRRQHWLLLLLLGHLLLRRLLLLLVLVLL